MMYVTRIQRMLKNIKLQKQKADTTYFEHPKKQMYCMQCETKQNINQLNNHKYFSPFQLIFLNGIDFYMLNLFLNLSNL